MQRWEYLEVVVVKEWALWWDSSGYLQGKALALVAPSGLKGATMRVRVTAPVIAEFGSQGWELTGTVPSSDGYTLFFKRPA